MPMLSAPAFVLSDHSALACLPCTSGIEIASADGGREHVRRFATLRSFIDFEQCRDIFRCKSLL